MTIPQLWTWLGIPTISSILIYIVRATLKYKKEFAIFKSAMQGMLRNQLMKDAREYLAEDSITELELFDWTSRYEAYHALGKNGVLDAINEKILNLKVNA